jgi:hypothetical protein
MNNQLNLGIIEGFLIASNAPPRIFEALAELRGVASVPEYVAPEVPAVPEQAVAEKKERKKRNLTDEQQQALLDRLKVMRANKAAKKNTQYALAKNISDNHGLVDPPPNQETPESGNAEAPL